MQVPTADIVSVEVNIAPEPLKVIVADFDPIDEGEKVTENMHD